MEKHKNADIVVWVNSIAPLQTGEEISTIVKYFIGEGLDSLITVKNKQVHCMYNNKPVNYESSTLFSLTQDLTPVQTFVYSIFHQC